MYIGATRGRRVEQRSAPLCGATRMVGRPGFEPGTVCLRGNCSTN